MGREVSAFIIITTGKHAGSVLVYHHLSVYLSIIQDTRAKSSSVSEEAYVSKLSVYIEVIFIEITVKSWNLRFGHVGGFFILPALKWHTTAKMLAILTAKVQNKRGE